LRLRSVSVTANCEAASGVSRVRCLADFQDELFDRRV
jgi:hypothetical protein